MGKIVMGVDIGGVIIDRINDGTDTSFFGDNYLQTTAVCGAFEAIKRLWDFSGGNLHLVSKCGRHVQEKTERWLHYHKFWGFTGLGPDKLHFCRERHEKAKICKDLGITHFVDDRLEVLNYLYPNVDYLFLFRGREEEMKKFPLFLDYVIKVNSWEEILKVFALEREVDHD